MDQQTLVLGGKQLEDYRPISDFTSTRDLFLHCTMSWQDYVNTQLIGKDLKDAAICGHDGNLWAKSENFNVTAGEIQAILQKYDNPSQLASSGLVLGGQKFLYLSGDDEVLRGKQGKRGVHLMKTNQTLLVGVYEAPMEPATAATVTEKLGDYLKGAGY